MHGKAECLRLEGTGGHVAQFLLKADPVRGDRLQTHTVEFWISSRMEIEETRCTNNSKANNPHNKEVFPSIWLLSISFSASAVMEINDEFFGPQHQKWMKKWKCILPVT